MDENQNLPFNNQQMRIYGVDGREDVFRVYIGDIDQTVNYYEPLIELLYNADEGDEINFVISSNGGLLDTTLAITNAIKSSKALCRAIITSHAYSAGSIIALACDELYAQPNSSMMCHMYTNGEYGKGNEIYASVDHKRKWFPKLANEYYETFLSTKEIKDMLEGKDIWLDADEVNTRWEVVMEKREERVKEIIEEREEEQLEELAETLREAGFDVSKITEGVEEDG